MCSVCDRKAAHINIKQDTLIHYTVAILHTTLTLNIIIKLKVIQSTMMLLHNPMVKTINTHTHADPSWSLIETGAHEFLNQFNLHFTRK